MGLVGKRRFVPLSAIGGALNIVVDGAAHDGTVLVLSHWPKSGTPGPLKADTSAEIVFNYLAVPAFHVDVDIVTGDHFDEDGLVGILALVDPDFALTRRDLIVDVAHAGDFGTYRDRRAARIAFTISAFADHKVSPLDPAVFRQPYAERTSALLAAVFSRLREIIDDTDRFEDLWRDEDEHLDWSERAVAERTVTVEEVAAADLAVVTFPEDWTAKPLHRFSQRRRLPCHPMAIHNATSCNRVLTMQGRRYVMEYRYESWVQYMTRPPPRRVDLGPLARQLTDQEPGAVLWRFDGVDALTPQLRLVGAEESAIPPDAFRRQLVEFLATAPPAWDPYDPA